MIAYGRIKWFDAKEGHGFIVTTEGEVFVHIDQIPGKVAPATGQRVSFMLTTGRRGLRAMSVKFEK